MQLIVQDPNGVPVGSYSNFSIDLQNNGDSNDGKCDFVLYVPNETLQKHSRILFDGTPFGGQVTRRCPSSDAENGDMISYKGRTCQGILADKAIVPPAGQSHLVVSGDANEVIGAVLERIGLDGFFEAPTTESGIRIASYRFNRYVNAWVGLRMMLAAEGGRLQLTCHDGKHRVEAVRKRLYGTAASERVYFDLDVDDLPYNHIIGLGKGTGANRYVCHWYANALGVISGVQTMTGLYERTYIYNLNSEEDADVASKSKSKLLELQTASEASLTLPPGESLDIGDRVQFSNSKFGIEAEAEIIQTVLKVNYGEAEVSYSFGTPNYPKDDE